jgi:hypothetical protein
MRIQKESDRMGIKYSIWTNFALNSYRFWKSDMVALTLRIQTSYVTTLAVSTQ